MVSIEQELDRYLSLLRDKMREREFTQMEVQEALGWGSSYISQLLTKQKSLRMDQVLLILQVIGAEPREFFLELYVMSPRIQADKEDQAATKSRQPRYGLAGVLALTHGLKDVLLEKGLITVAGLSDAVRDAARETD